MKKPVSNCRGSYLGVAKAAMELAEQDTKELDQIAADLEAGNEQQALVGMRKYFHMPRKPIVSDREKDYDREDYKNRDKIRA